MYIFMKYFDIYIYDVTKQTYLRYITTDICMIYHNNSHICVSLLKLQPMSVC